MATSRLNTTRARTEWLKSFSATLGFDFCGIARAAFLDEDAYRLEAWLNKGFHGKMAYMENHFDKRLDPTLLVPGAQSVVTLMLNYYPEEQQVTDGPKISKYAYGMDYHEVIRQKLNRLFEEMKTVIGDISGRGFVDSAPVLERSWARKSGLGWVGKNGNLINKKAGSFFFIATLITDVAFDYDNPYAKDYCGSCTRCLDACPTDAIVSPAVIDGSKCISYLTIELRDELLPQEFSGKMDNWMFGCDACQDVCPWNRFSTPHSTPEFSPVPAIFNFSSAEWEMMTEDIFRNLLRNSPVKRTKWKGIQRNLKFIRSRESGSR